MKAKFLEQIATHETNLKKENSRYDVIGYMKLLLTLAISILIYFVFTKGPELRLLISGAIFLILLIGLWYIHSKLLNKINYIKGVVAINNMYLDRISKDWINFPEQGESHINKDHAYSFDLDIVGKKSLFQLLNITHTWHGRKLFIEDLHQSNYSKIELEIRQKAVLELSQNFEFVILMEYLCSKIGLNVSIQKFIDGLKDNLNFMSNKSLKIIMKSINLVVVISSSLVIILELKQYYLIVWIFALLQMILFLLGIKKTQEYLSVMNSLNSKLDDLTLVIETITNKNFKSKQLKAIQSRLNLAQTAIKHLSKIESRVSVKGYGLVWFLLNVVLFWDYRCAFLLEEWKQKYASQIEDWFLAVGEFESLASLSTLANIRQQVCFPSLIEQKKTINVSNLGHPLLNDESRVDNSFVCNDQIFIISGSNMSGKTTFLRTVGINLVLAQAGGFVCAEKMENSLCKILTSMRISDDLNEGISTFYAELKRIKTILEGTKKDKNTLFLIDEIFRGTNSVDRLSGAKTILTKLNDLQGFGMLTTHDLELCELENHIERIQNYSFSEYYKENKIYFDYKLKNGKSSTTNAKYLMEIIGIL